MEKLLIFVLAISTALADEAQIVQHGELQGLNFYKIGDLKLVTKFLELEITKNLSTIEEQIAGINSILDDEIYDARNKFKDAEKIKNPTEKEQKVKDDLKQHLRDLQRLQRLNGLKGYEFSDITSSFDSSRSRSKRSLIPNSKDDLEIFRKGINDLIHGVHEFQVKQLNFTNHSREIFEDSDKKLLLQILHMKIIRIEKSLESIIVMQIQNRLNTHLVSYQEFKELLMNQTRLLTDDEEFPYGMEINKYFYNLAVRHEIVYSEISSDYFLKLTIDIPIVEKSPRALFKIDEIPALLNEALVITNVGWKFIASSSDDYAMFTQLDDCYKNGLTYLCETQSAIHKTADDCITKAFVERKIDAKFCDLELVGPQKIFVVRLSNERFFYYTPEVEEIKVTCERMEKRQLEKSGEIHLPPGCTVSHKNFKLVATFTHEVKTVEISFETGFDREELIKRANGEISALESNSLYQSMEKLNDVVKEKKLEKVADLNFPWWSKVNWLLVAVLVAALIVGGCAAKYTKCLLCLNQKG